MFVALCAYVRVCLWHCVHTCVCVCGTVCIRACVRANMSTDESTVILQILSRPLRSLEPVHKAVPL